MTKNNQVKIIYVLLDGVGDLPHPNLAGKTPLEAATTENMDKLAKNGIMGQVISVGKGIAPESDIAVFNMLGYKFQHSDYAGRGVIEAIGVGIDFRDGDLALRGNFATLDHEGKIIDRRAGRKIEREDAEKISNEIEKKIIFSNPNTSVVVAPTIGHRIIVRLRDSKPLSSAILLNPEIAKTYPNVKSLREDEPLLSMEPSNIAISKAEYLFFTPRIRKTGDDLKTEINSKFKAAIEGLKENTSIINCLPTGFNGNNDNISFLKHVTGFEAGKSISYFYFPVQDLNKIPEVVGSLKKTSEKKVLSLLKIDKKERKLIDISSAEYLHAINTIQRFSSLCSILEVCKFVKNDTKHSVLFNNFRNIYLDDMITGLYDLRTLGSSFESSQTLMYLINGSVRGITGYIKRLIDAIRITLKKNELKAARTKIILSWTLDANEMRGDRIEILNTIASKLRDYIGDIETSAGAADLFQHDKTTIIIACSNFDYNEIMKSQKDEDIFVIKANPLCEI